MGVIGLKQLLQKRYKYLEHMTAAMLHSFGNMTTNFVMLVWGKSGNGKSNLIMQLVKIFLRMGNVLYVSLEEGHESTIQQTALKHLNDDSPYKILFADNEENYESLTARLKKKKSPRFVIVDSLQYLDMDYEGYKKWKQIFKNKGFVFISHAEGKEPKGQTAKSIRYDAPIKVHVQGFVAFVTSRFGGNNPFLIWEGDKPNKGARGYWGKKLKSILGDRPPKEEVINVTKPIENEKTEIPNLVES
ncbi:MAG: hypothetical protein HOP30_11175 [Cyclobacteriaceae bacterium]|nr:hypothetical protein [Cyclobacteriaceae bacterium]